MLGLIGHMRGELARFHADHMGGLLRSAVARTKQALEQGIGQLLNVFAPAECANYIRHGGYGSSG